MAWLEEDPKYGTFKVAFRFNGKRYKRPLDTRDRKEADRVTARLEENIKLVERGRLELRHDVDLPTFLLSDGKRAQSPKLPDVLTLEDLFERYRVAHSSTHEKSTLDTIDTHAKSKCSGHGSPFPLNWGSVGRDAKSLVSGVRAFARDDPPLASRS